MHHHKAAWLSALTLATATFLSASGARAQVTGQVKLDGDAPEMKEIDMSGVKECAEQHADPVYEETVVTGDGGGLANVIVYVKTDDPGALGGEAPTEPVVLDQEGCQYKPHVLSITTGQDFLVRNSDPFLHNVHSLASVNPAFNFGQPNKDPGKKVDSPKAAEFFRVKCDVHPWMSAYVGAFEHPFHAVTDDQGMFAIPTGLPDGDYTLGFWHEKLGEQEQQITVKDGKAEGVSASYKPEAAANDAADPVAGDVRLAADVKPAAAVGSCGTGGCCAAKGTVVKVEPAAPADSQAAAQ